MKTCTLIVHDQTNVSLRGLDPAVRRKLVENSKFFVPHSRHTPTFKLGRWDGYVNFTNIAGDTYLNLLDRLLPIVEEAGYFIELQDHRRPMSVVFPEITEDYFVRHSTNPYWPPGHPHAGKPIMLRDYQVDVIKTLAANPQAIVVSPTGSGKTIMTAALSHAVEKFGRTIIIVPNKSLVTQTEADYKNVGLDVGVFFGDRKEYDRQHTICTWQSLAVLSKKSKSQRADYLNEFIKDVVAVIVDECHTSKSTQLRDLLTGPFAHIPIRWGLTGTIPKDEVHYYALLTGLGPVAGKLQASSLQEQGVLANCMINVIQTKDEINYGDYQQEYSYLVTDPKRIDWMAEYIDKLSENGNTLVLVDRIQTGEMLVERIPGSSFVSGSTNAAKRKNEYDSIQVTDNRVLVATYGVAAVGINIPRIFNLILVEPGKSFVRVIQSIGRGLRKAEDKDRVEIYDIHSLAKFSKRQFNVRRKYYDEANYPYEIKYVKYK